MGHVLVFFSFLLIEKERCKENHLPPPDAPQNYLYILYNY